MHNKINIRVYKRGYKSTILIWNIDPLTPIERQNYSLWVKTEDTDWWVPETSMPDTQRMGPLLDGNTDTIAIMHDDRDITADTGFVVRLLFSDASPEGARKEAILRVEPSNQHRMFTKPERIVTETGKTVYAENAHVISIDQKVVDKIARAVKDMLK